MTLHIAITCDHRDVGTGASCPATYEATLADITAAAQDASMERSEIDTADRLAIRAGWTLATGRRHHCPTHR